MTGSRCPRKSWTGITWMDMTNINCIHACDFQIINLKHHVKKKIKLGESQTQNA